MTGSRWTRGAIPEADAGVMTEVVENAVGAFLSQAALLSSALIGVANSTELAQLLMPGDPAAAEHAVPDSPSQWDQAQDRFDERTADR